LIEAFFVGNGEFFSGCLFLLDFLLELLHVKEKTIYAGRPHNEVLLVELFSENFFILFAVLFEHGVGDSSPASE
jgi:hypothetical protein